MGAWTGSREQRPQNTTTIFAERSKLCVCGLCLGGWWRARWEVKGSQKPAAGRLAPR